MGERVQLTVNLPAETVEQLEQLAEARGRTLANTIQRSIRVNTFLADQMAQRKNVVLERPDRMFERVILGS